MALPPCCKCHAADVTEVDQQDVASELVNMIGGNLKSLLPGPSFLSLPTIVSGAHLACKCMMPNCWTKWCWPAATG